MQTSTNLFHSIGTEPIFSVDLHLRLRTIHQSTNLSKIGLWYEGTTTWIGEEGWIINAAFSQTATTISSQAYHKGLNVKVTIRDEQIGSDLGVKRSIVVKNESNKKRSFKLLFHHLSLASDEGLAFYSPAEKALIHYTNNCYSLFSLHTPKALSLQHGAGLIDLNWNSEEGKLFFSPFSATNIESIGLCAYSLEPNALIEATSLQLSSPHLSLIKQFNKRLIASV